MSHIKLSVRARDDIIQLYNFLAQFDLTIADNGNDAIIAGLEYLEAHPLSGAPVEDRPNVRKSIVAFGASGYLIFHKRYVKMDTNLVARIIHQKEWYDARTIGLAEEKIEDIQLN
jgi:plasmid stabilization system protein ParE